MFHRYIANHMTNEFQVMAQFENRSVSGHRFTACWKNPVRIRASLQRCHQRPQVWTGFSRRGLPVAAQQLKPAHSTARGGLP